jgi:myotubularin-related protein 1/2
VFEPGRGLLEDASSSVSFYGKIESSGWTKHVRLILKASVELALSVHNGVSVLTHCSDGWDRTAQMVSLAELMLDPFYRTLRGFQVLVEKEWCSFGHQFAARSGHARSDVSNDQRSPVFLLWLDCVWQYTRQFPTECEFNEKLLLALADHVYSCKYGTFMFDCERQR